MRKSSLLAIGFVISVMMGCDYKPRNQGKALYERHCQNCHMENGQGLSSLIPPVAHADYVVSRKDELACIIRNGVQGEMIVNGVTYEGAMEGNARLTDIEINNLIHYILVDLNAQKESFDLVEIKAQLERCKES